MTTIRDVARYAGVSVATISRALSSPEVVAPETLEIVMAAVRALDYTPNLAAKTLRTTKTGKILVTVPNIANPFFAQIIQGVEEAALAAGYAVLLGDTQNDPEREERYALMFRRKEADGLIFLGHRLPAAAADLNSGDIPPVVNGCEFDPDLAIPSVHIDNRAAAIEAMEHLYGLGHRRIGVITGSLESPLSRERLDGVRTCAHRHEAIDDLIVTSGDFSIASGAGAAGKLLSRKRRPTAIFCFNDEMAIGALERARQRGLLVPRDLSLVGFDDIGFAAYVTPALTTISQPARDIGRHTVRLLLEILGGAAREPARVTLAHRLVVRVSTGPVA